MIIDHYKPGEEEKFEGVLAEYNSQVEHRFFSPWLVPDKLSYEVNDSRGAVTARENGEFRGILFYYVFSPGDFESLEFNLKKLCSRPIADSNGNQINAAQLRNFQMFYEHTFQEPFLFLSLMESFRKRIGVGRKLVDSVKGIDSEGIFLEALPQTPGFYSRLGFKETGVYVHHENPKLRPLMTWRRE